MAAALHCRDVAHFNARGSCWTPRQLPYVHSHSLEDVMSDPNQNPSPGTRSAGTDEPVDDTQYSNAALPLLWVAVPFALVLLYGFLS